MAPTKLISTSVGFQDAKGNVVALGLLSLTLSQNAEVTSGGGQVTTEPLYFALDASGKITSSAIYFNDELTPSGTVYKAILYASNGMRIIQDFGYWSITGASADLSAMVPTSTGASYPSPVLQNPSAQQNINGQTLNMEGASLGFSAAGSTTPDSFFSRLSAGVVAVGTAIGNALATLRAAIYQIGGSDTGISRIGAASVGVGDGTQASNTGNVQAGNYYINAGAGGVWNFIAGMFDQISTGGVRWSSGANATTGIDTGVTRGGAAATVAIGNGTAGDASGTIKLTALNHGGTLSLPTSTDTLVGKATTDTLTSKTLTGASSGNSVTLINFQGVVGALTGNSADQTLYTFTVPANTIAVSKGIRVRVFWHHTTGTASVTYKISFGGTNIFSHASVGTLTAFYDGYIFNSGNTSSQVFASFYSDANTASFSDSGTTAINTTSGAIILVTFNVANTDQLTGVMMFVEQIQ